MRGHRQSLQRSSLSPGRGKLVDHRNHAIDFFAGVVEGQRGPHRLLHPKTPQDRLGAVVSRPHGNAFAAERLSDLGGREALEHERRDAGFIGGGTDQAEARNREQALRGVGQQIMLVTTDVLDAERLGDLRFLCVLHFNS